MSIKETNPVDNGKDTFSEPGFSGELQIPPDEMLNLAHQTAELLIKRIENLPGEDAWDGDFQQELEARLLEEPPETGRPAMEVIERALKDVLPLPCVLITPEILLLYLPHLPGPVY